MPEPTKYLVDVQVEVELEGGEEAAFEAVDVLMQRAWDTDQGRHHVRKWHYEMYEGCVRTAEDEPDDTTTKGTSDGPR